MFLLLLAACGASPTDTSATSDSADDTGDDTAGGIPDDPDAPVDGTLTATAVHTIEIDGFVTNPRLVPIGDDFAVMSASPYDNSGYWALFPGQRQVTSFPTDPWSTMSAMWTDKLEAQPTAAGGIAALIVPEYNTSYPWPGYADAADATTTDDELLGYVADTLQASSGLWDGVPAFAFSESGSDTNAQNGVFVASGSTTGELLSSTQRLTKNAALVTVLDDGVALAYGSSDTDCEAPAFGLEVYDTSMSLRFASCFIATADPATSGGTLAAGAGLGHLGYLTVASTGDAYLLWWTEVDPKSGAVIGEPRDITALVADVNQLWHGVRVARGHGGWLLSYVGDFYTEAVALVWIPDAGDPTTIDTQLTAGSYDYPADVATTHDGFLVASGDFDLDLLPLVFR